MLVTVFGTQSPSESEYQEAYLLGKLIGNYGYTLKNGGYEGSMEASAKGCYEEKGSVIGVCIENHIISTEGKPNDFLTEIITTKSLYERINELLKADVIIVLSGKLGTLEELFCAWANNIEKQAEGKTTIPIYVIGEKNKMLIEFLEENNFINPEEHFVNIHFLETIKQLDFLVR